MSIVDIRHVDRHIPIHPEDWEIQSFQIDGKYYIDLFLSFGLSIAPTTFSMFTTAVRDRAALLLKTMIVVYLDEFCLLEMDKTKVNHALDQFIRLLEKLGFKVHIAKIVRPCTRTRFLGFIVDTVLMLLQVPPEKMDHLKELLTQVKENPSLTLRQAERLVGKLVFYCKAVRGGRTFSRRMINYLNSRRHGIWQSQQMEPEMIKDVKWWLAMMDVCNGTALIPQPSEVVIMADACNQGCGGWMGNQAFQYSGRRKSRNGISTQRNY